MSGDWRYAALSFCAQGGKAAGEHPPNAPVLLRNGETEKDTGGG